jgi:hypothetical protein
VSDDDHIDKLEALLERVRGRPRDPNPPPPAPETPVSTIDVAALDIATPVPAPNPAPAPVAPNGLDVPTPVHAFMPSSIPPPSSEPSTQPVGPRRDTLRPGNSPGLFGLGPPDTSRVRPMEPPPPAPADAAPAQGYEAPPMEVVELDIDPNPSVPPPPVSGHVVESWDTGRATIPHEEPFESRSRLVSAPPAAPSEPVEPSEPPVASSPILEVASAEISATELEARERAPTSSRRPISMEEKMNEPDDYATALHAPPPESGKLPTAAPAIELQAVQPELPPRADVAVFVTAPKGELARTTFGELMDDALSL